LTQVLRAELVLAGGIAFSDNARHQILSQVTHRLRTSGDLKKTIGLKGLGSFRLRRARPDWVNGLLLGALDYYREREVVAYQVLPDEKHSTGDVPDMTKKLTASANRAWTWFHKAWAFPVPKGSVAVTNLVALRGERITEVARWEEDEWELFAGPGPDVDPKDARRVPLGVLLGLDPSLERVVNLQVGQALWRDDESGDWNEWVRKQSH
jgi:hypothetical protein